MILIGLFITFLSHHSMIFTVFFCQTNKNISKMLKRLTRPVSVLVFTKNELEYSQ